MLRVSSCGGPRFACSLLLHRTDSTVAATASDGANAKSYEKIPGPKPLPLVGNAWRFMPIIGDLSNMDFKTLSDVLHNKYGKIAKLSNLKNRKDLLFLYDPADIETILRNEGNWPIRNGIRSVMYYQTVLRKDFYNGTLSTAAAQGQQWQDIRSKLNQPLMQPRNAKLYIGFIDEVADQFIDRLRELRNGHGVLPDNLMTHLNRWALESIATIALDTRLGCLAPNLPNNSEPMKVISAVQIMFDSVYELEFKPSIRHFTKRSAWKDLVEALDYFNGVCMKYIEQAKTRIQSQPRDDSREQSILEQLLKTNKEMVAFVMALDMILGGIDTTANAAALVLHYLARNKDKQQKLFKELQGILPSKSQKLVADDLDAMKYLKACIKESLRITPIASANLRETVKDVVLGGWRVPPGVDVVMCHQLTSNQENQYHDPQRFIPERWLKGDASEHKAHPFATLPFGFGPRMCIGRRLAELEMMTLVAKIVRKYRLEYDTELQMKLKVLNSVISPLNFRLEERDL